MAKFTTKFDEVYDAHAPGVPVVYLRALAAFESNSNPKSKPSHRHWGLLQVGKKALAGFNKSKGTRFKLKDVLNPVLNVRIWFHRYKMYLRVFRRIRELIGKRGVNFVEDWANKQFALMVTTAWNTGIGDLKRAALAVPMVFRVTHANLFDTGRKKVSKKRFSRLKQAWQNQVVGAFLGLKQKPIDPKLPAKGEGFGFKFDWKMLVLAWLVFGRKKGRR